MASAASSATVTAVAKAQTTLTANVTLDLARTDGSEINLTLAKTSVGTSVSVSTSSDGSTTTTASFSASVVNGDDVVVVGNNAVKDIITNFEVASWTENTEDNTFAVGGDRLVFTEAETVNNLALSREAGKVSLVSGHTTVGLAQEASDSGIFRITTGGVDNGETLLITGYGQDGSVGAALDSGDVAMLNASSHLWALGSSASLVLTGGALADTVEADKSFTYKASDLLAGGEIYQNTAAKSNVTKINASTYDGDLLITEVQEVSLGAADKNVTWAYGKKDAKVQVGSGKAGIWYWSETNDGKLSVDKLKKDDRLYLIDGLDKFTTTIDGSGNATFTLDTNNQVAVTLAAGTTSVNGGYNVTFATTNEAASLDSDEGVVLGQLKEKGQTLEFNKADNTVDVGYYGGGAETLKISDYVSDDKFVKIWLGHQDADQDGTQRIVDNNVTTIDASGSHRNLILVGNSGEKEKSTLKGGTWANNLWGGSAAADTMEGSKTALTVFWFGNGDGKDTITGGTTSTQYQDEVNLWNVTSADINNGLVTIKDNVLTLAGGDTLTVSYGSTGNSITKAEATAALAGFQFNTSDGGRFEYKDGAFVAKN